MQQTQTATQFFGIADDQEQTVRFAAPVEILRVGSVSGQAVSVGDLILEVRQPELDTELQILADKLRELSSGNVAERASMQAEIMQQDANLRATLAGLDTDIRTLRARQLAARAMLNDPTDLTSRRTYGGDSSIALTLEDLHTRRQALVQSTAARIGDLRARLASAARPVDAQLAEIRQRQQALQRQRTAQRVYASIDGQVGSVLFKAGDTVPPYQPVVTLHGTRPTFIKG